MINLGSPLGVRSYNASALSMLELAEMRVECECSNMEEVKYWLESGHTDLAKYRISSFESFCEAFDEYLVLIQGGC